MKKQFFPFGRGSARKAKRRVFVQYEALTGTLQLRTLSLRVARIAEPDRVLFIVGTTKLQGKRRVFVSR